MREKGIRSKESSEALPLYEMLVFLVALSPERNSFLFDSRAENGLRLLRIIATFGYRIE